MAVLQWRHTRTGKPMVQKYTTIGQALVTVMRIRAIYPRYPMTLNGKEI